MKKLFIFAALVLGMASCQKDVNSLEVNVGEQETVVTVSLPEVTRANSADSGLALVDLSGDYTLRYIFQVFDENGENGAAQQIVYSDDRFASFRVQLVPEREYTFVAWADIVKEDEQPLHYAVDANMNVTMINEWGVMDETRDAFYCSAVRKFNGTLNSLELKRPFAKIRVVTDDIDKLLNGQDLVSGKVTYNTNCDVYTQFNAISETAHAAAAREVEFTYNDNVYYKKYVEKEYQRTLYADYLFVNSDETVSFTLENNLATNNFSTDIPVERNKVTTIFGSLLTNGSDIRVEVKDEFEQPGNTVFDAFERGGEVVLDKNYDLASTLYVKSGVKATLNLNGKTLKSLYDENNYTDVIIVEEGAELTINGDGTIEAVGGKSNFTVIVDGKLTINGGTFKSGVDEVNDPNAVIYVRGNGEAYVNGGNFPNEYNSKYILNKRDADRATTTIKVRGGRFQNFNPGNNAAENAGTNFLAEGCVSVADGEWFDVIYDPYYGYTKVSDVAGLKKAATDKANKIYLNPGVYTLDDVVYFTSNVELVSDGPSSTKIIGKIVADENFNAKGIRFEGNDTVNTTLASKYGSYVNKTSAGALCSLITCVKNASFEECTIVSNISKSWRGINHTTSSDLYELNINKCAFEGDFYFISTRINFNIQNCTFNSTYNGDGLAAVWCYGLRDAGSPAKKGTIVFSNNENVSTNGKILVGVYFNTANFVFDADMTMENNIGWGEYAFDYGSKAVFGDVTLNGTKITK